MISQFSLRMCEMSPYMTKKSQNPNIVLSENLYKKNILLDRKEASKSDMEFVTNFTRTYVSRKSFTPKCSGIKTFLAMKKT